MVRFAVELCAFALTTAHSTHAGLLSTLQSTLHLTPGSLGDNVITPRLLKKAQMEDTTKQCIREINDAVTTLGACKGPAKFMRLIDDHYEDTAKIKSADVSVGWYKDENNEWQKIEPRLSDTVKKLLPFKHDKPVTAIALPRVSDSFKPMIASIDEFFGDTTAKETAATFLKNNDYIFPLDNTRVYRTNDEANKMAKDLNYEMGKALPQTYMTNFTQTTAESFSRMFFNSLGAPLLEKQTQESVDENGFMVDMSFLHQFDVREEYMKYGAKVYFDDNQLVEKIEVSANSKTYYRDDEDFDFAMMVAKVSMFTLTTVREHLVWAHLIVSLDMTRETVINLAPDHPLRRLLTVFEYRATEVNYDAFASLVPEHSLLHRSCGFTYKSMVKIFEHSYTEAVAYQPYPERMQAMNTKIKGLVGNNMFPYAAQGVRAWETFRTFAKSWMTAAGPRADDEQARKFYEGMRVASQNQKYVLGEYSLENMLDLLATCMWTVTTWHELIGHVIDYAIQPDHSGFRLSALDNDSDHDSSRIDMQAWINTLAITGSTSLPMPKLMSPFDNYFGVGEAPDWERTEWDKFQSQLKELSTSIQAEDKARIGEHGYDHEFKYFDPIHYESSISV